MQHEQQWKIGQMNQDSDLHEQDSSQINYKEKIPTKSTQNTKLS